MKVITLIGGPCLGKSVLAADIFSELKKINANAEYVPEYAKSLVWEDRQVALSNQLYIFAKQAHAQVRLLNKVDYAISDSPLILNLAYSQSMPKCYHELVVKTFSEFDNINLFLLREFEFQSEGRTQKNQSEAIEKDTEILTILNNNSIPYTFISPSKFNAKEFALTLTSQ